MVNHYANDIEYYSTIEEFITETDLIETDVYISGWNKKFRITALSFGKQEDINKKATDKETNQLDHTEWVLWTLVHGVVRPKLNYAQAKQLMDKNGQFINSLADEIWNIGRVSKKAFDEYIQKLSELHKLEEEAAAARDKRK